MTRPVPRALLRALLCVLPLVAFGCPKPRPAVGVGLRKADQLLSEGKPAEALAAYNAARNEPPPGHAQRGMGLSHEALGDRDAAIAALTDAQKALPDDPVVRLALSRLYACQNDRTQALAHATYVFEHHPDNLTALIMLGALAQNADDAQKAIDRLLAWRNDPTQKHKVVVEWVVALWDLFQRKRDDVQAEQTWALADGAPLGNVDAAVMMSGVYVGLGRLDTAERLLSAVVSAQPTRLDAQRRLAFLASDREHYALALRALRTFESDAHKLGETILRARVLVASNLGAEALAELRDRIGREAALGASQQQRGQLRYWLGRALVQRGELEAAIASYTEATQVWPDMIPAHLGLAEARLLAGQLDAAIAGLEAAVASHPKAADLFGLLGSARMTQGRYAEAEAAFVTRAALVPDDAGGAHLIGVALKAQNKDALAIEKFEHALQRDPAFVDALEALTGMLTAAGKVNEAEALFQRAVGARPDRIEAWIAFARFYNRAGNHARSSAVIQQALRQAPDHVGALSEAAQIAVSVGQYAQAAALSQRLLAVQPDSLLALNNLAVLYDEQLKQPEQALATAQRAIAIAPSNPHVQDTLGWILQRQGSHAEALKHLQAAAQALKDNAVVQFHYGMALMGAGQANEGKAALRKALTLNPNFQGAAQARAAL